LFAVGWGFWLGIIAIVVNLINLLIFSSDMLNKKHNTICVRHHYAQEER
jgi:hypothetical protein